MKRFFALLLALIMALSCTALAGEFNAGVELDTDDDGNTTVTVQDSDLFDTQTVTLTVACDLENAYVVYEGETVESTLADGKITFAVIGGGTYTILERDDPPAGEQPEEPGDSDVSDERPPVRPVGPSQKEEEPQQPQPVVLPFGDLTAADWFYTDVAWVYENGLMNGMTDTAFGPDATTSRGMIVTILWRLEGQPAAGSCPFADVKAGSYYEQAIAWAAEKGIVNGVDATAFNPDGTITREQFATILYRYAKEYKGYDVSMGEDTNILSYADAFSISDYAFPALQWACGAGIMNGSGDALLPGGSANRAQAAALLHRFCTYYQN